MTRSNSSSWSEGANCGPELWPRIYTNGTPHWAVHVSEERGEQEQRKAREPTAKISELI